MLGIGVSMTWCNSLGSNSFKFGFNVEFILITKQLLYFGQKYFENKQKFQTSNLYMQNVIKVAFCWVKNSEMNISMSSFLYTQIFDLTLISFKEINEEKWTLIQKLESDMTKSVQALSVGRLRYGQALKLQKLISDRVKEKKQPNTLVIVEHDPVYTVGIRDKSYSEDDEKKLVAYGAEFYRTNRGGLITFHGPGQMVVYPIIDLRNFSLGVRSYVHNLEQTIIDLCDGFGLKAKTSPHTGVWVDDHKICALGIHASRFVTTHGLALNCNVELSWFSHIVPCGIEGKFVTSLSEQLRRNVGIEDALPIFKDCFSKRFNCEIVSSDASQDLDKLVRQAE